MNKSTLKQKKIENINKKLERIAIKSLANNKCEKAIKALSAKAYLQYLYNQSYIDSFIEKMIIELSEKTSDKLSHNRDDDTILFYDGFGFDMRGLAYIYLKAMVELDYKIIYISIANEAKHQPQIAELLKEQKIYNIGSEKNSLKRLKLMREIANKEHFSNAFFYTMPNDIVGAVFFYEMRYECTRYQINLTDHAFWIGLNAFDYCIEFREYGARISNYYRYIGKEKLIELPYYPIINENIEFEGFPFDSEGKKVIFSGGALYKTIDKDRTYYRLVESIVKKHNEVVFLYAGYGNTEYLEELIAKYPTQVYYMEERKDLYGILKNSYLYLNTYPISGGLMLQYAARASCIPITFRRKWDDDASGVLRNETELDETFYNMEDVLAEIDKLISNQSYWEMKKEILKNMVISEKEFTDKLGCIISGDYQGMLYDKLDKIDTSLFLEGYKNNISYNDVVDSLITMRNRCLYIDFPILFVIKILNKLLKR